MKPWETLATAMTPEGSCFELLRHDGNYVNSAQTSLYRSTDGLLTYSRVATTEGLPNGPQGRFAFEDIVFAPSDPNIVYAATAGLLVYRSADAGTTFTLMKNIRSEVLSLVP